MAEMAAHEHASPHGITTTLPQPPGSRQIGATNTTPRNFRDQSPQQSLHGPSSPRRGRVNLTLAPQQQHDEEEATAPPASHSRRDSNSMSRGRTRRPTDEYKQPPRDPAAYETSSAEEIVYLDARGEFSARSAADDNATTDAAAPARGGGARRSRVGRWYQRRMLGDGYGPRVAVFPCDEGVFEREREARKRAAEMDRMERESQQLVRPPEIGGLGWGLGRRQERKEWQAGARAINGGDLGCCVML